MFFSYRTVGKVACGLGEAQVSLIGLGWRPDFISAYLCGPLCARGFIAFARKFTADAEEAEISTEKTSKLGHYAD